MYKLMNGKETRIETKSICEIYNHFEEGCRILKDDKLICKTESAYCNTKAKVGCCESHCPAWKNPELSYIGGQK